MVESQQWRADQPGGGRLVVDLDETTRHARVHGGGSVPTCPRGHANPAGTAFCGDCGTPLAPAGDEVPAQWKPQIEPPVTRPCSATCPRCVAPVVPGAGFCGECGSLLSAGSAPAPSPAAVSAEPAGGAPFSPATRGTEQPAPTWWRTLIIVAGGVLAIAPFLSWWNVPLFGSYSLYSIRDISGAANAVTGAANAAASTLGGAAGASQLGGAAAASAGAGAPNGGTLALVMVAAMVLGGIALVVLGAVRGSWRLRSVLAGGVVLMTLGVTVPLGVAVFRQVGLLPEEAGAIAAVVALVAAVASAVIGMVSAWARATPSRPRVETAAAPW